MSGAIRPLTQYLFMAWCSVKKSAGTFIIIIIIIVVGGYNIICRYINLPCISFVINTFIRT